MQEKIKAIFEDVLNMKFKDDSEFIKVVLDSLDFINILFKLENELKIKIPNDAIVKNKLDKVANLLEYIQNNKPDV